jgi:hypothetical protein
VQLEALRARLRAAGAQPPPAEPDAR